MPARSLPLSELRALQRARESREAANEAGVLTFAKAERLANALDRHSGDWGTDPDRITDIGDRIERITTEVVEFLGEPATAIWQRGDIIALVRR